MYSQAGLYSIALSTADDNGGSATQVLNHYVIIYDPEGSFVTGGDWFNSPEGAYTSDPSLSGKANFGFASKDKKGASAPTESTEFQFKTVDLNFHSSSYDWLIIAGHRALYKSIGTINGQRNYGFMLSAIDESLTPSTDVSLFRIRIWDKDNNSAIIYDNQIGGGDADDADPATEIRGGKHRDSQIMVCFST